MYHDFEIRDLYWRINVSVEQLATDCGKTREEIIRILAKDPQWNEEYQ